MNKNILFVDDDVNLLKSYQRQFRKKYNVQTATSGGEAIRILLEGKVFPVIISDYNLPLLNGIEFFEAIKKISPKTIKILVTGNASRNIAIDANINGNIFRFISKPFEKKSLKNSIEDAFKQYKLTSIEKSDLLKNEFFSMLSHKIRAPLNGITNFIDLIKEEIDKSNCDRVKPYFDILEHDTERLFRTIHLMKDISLVMSETVNLKFEPINIVPDIFAPLLKKYVVKAEEKNIVIDLNLDSKDYKIISDRYCIEQIFSNILENSLIFSNNGLVSIAITQTETNFIVKISDEGIGMEENFQRKMFEPFIQENSEDPRSHDGNGLGLTLVKEYCNLLDIEIKVESKKGLGSTFQLKMKREE